MILREDGWKTNFRMIVEIGMLIDSMTEMSKIYFMLLHMEVIMDMSLNLPTDMKSIFRDASVIIVQKGNTWCPYIDGLFNLDAHRAHDPI